MLEESKKVLPDYFKDEMKEGNEILSIVVSSIKTARSNKLSHVQTR